MSKRTLLVSAAAQTLTAVDQVLNTDDLLSYSHTQVRFCVFENSVTCREGIEPPMIQWWTTAPPPQRCTPGPRHGVRYLLTV